MAPPHDRTDSASALARASAAVAELVDGDAGDLTDDELRDHIVGLHQLIDRTHAAFAAHLDRFDARTVWLGDGARSASAWIAARVEATTGQAAVAVHTARDLRSCPGTSSAYWEGRIGTAKTRLAMRARRAHPDLYAEHETDLIDTIEPLTVAQAASVLAHWAALAEATRNDGEPEADPAEHNTFRYSRTLDGRWYGELDLDAITGADLDSVITGFLDKAFRNGTYAPCDGTTTAGRNAAALVDLALRGADPNATTHGKVRPSASITIDHQTLTGIPADDVEDGLARRCHLDDGTPITRSAAERLLCTAHLTAIATKLHTDGTIETTGITDLKRHPTAKQRRALDLRDRGCAFPGCHAPTDWCDAHHLTPFHRGGPTTLSNMVLLCRRHHHLVHEGNWRLCRTPDGTLHLDDPHRTPVTCTPHGHLHPYGPAPPNPPPPPLPPPARFRRAS